ncbi:NAD(P)/FAD-dependent oxidoreductase [Candidatus Woesearchaeota archaeon]|nr:NAD(P)/FAD-dependent oxidoreductase [Candidatus Woesearchaeota archaeon]
MTISVIGAGPAGSYSAYLLAKEGFNVNLYEEHNLIGKPIQCTGITTSFIENYINNNADFVVNKIDTVMVHSYNNNVEFKLKRKNIVMDRCGMDNYFLNKALDKGVKLFTGHRFIEANNNELIFKQNNKKVNVKKEIVIGADGPNSQVAKSFNLKGKRENFLGLQATVKGNFDSSTFEVYLGNKICPGFFAWIVPENDKIARIGLAVREGFKGRDYFEAFVKDKGKIMEMQAGLIPIYNNKLETEKNNIYLVGDAASQVKATTGGGILYALMASEELSKAIKNNESYEKNWKGRIGYSLMVHLLLRNYLDKFNDEDYSKLLELFNDKSARNLIESYDREFPIKLLMKLVLAQPKLLKYIGKVV